MPWKPLPGREPDRVSRVGDSVERLLRQLGAPPADALTVVFSRWEELVGPRVAAHAEPVGVEHGRLAVRVDDPAWASQIRWLERDLLDHANAALGPGTITGIDVRIGTPRRGSASRRRTR